MTLDQSGSEMQQLADEFYMFIGNCVSAWAGVEDELFQVCWRVLRCAPEHAAIVYYRTPNLDARLTLATELVGSVLPKRNPPSGGHDHPDVRVWRDIETEFRGLLRVRNRIAHHSVWPTYRMESSDDLMTAPITISGFELYYSRHEELRGRIAGPALRLEDLKNHLNATAILTSRLHHFLHDVLLPYTRTFVSEGPLPG